MELSFAQLNLSEACLKQLEEIGFEQPTPIQIQAIPPLLAGEDVIGQAQTGTGKTAAFGLPVLDKVDSSSRDVQALILTPTRELAQQVNQALRQLNPDRHLWILAAYGGQSLDRQIQRLQKGVQIVVGTPGRVLDLIERGCLKLDGVKQVVLDEADEMLSMGFLDDVETILSHTPEERQTAFFSATMDRSLQQFARKFMRSPEIVKAPESKSTPKRIYQTAYMVPKGYAKSDALYLLLELEEPESAIIFVRTRRGASQLTSELQSAGYSAEEFHGDLNQSQRERLLHRFRNKQVRLLVATDIAARGLDVDHLTHVINFDLPDNVESYVHRIGRTGRAGRTGKALATIQYFERRKLRKIESHLRQHIKIRSLPGRSAIESRRVERMEEDMREALKGERLASFLPIVAKLNEEYDPHAIAAAALQMAYDAKRPQRPSLPEPPTRPMPRQVRKNELVKTQKKD